MTLPPEFLAGLTAKRDEASQARQRVYDAQQKLALVEAELRGFEMAARLLDKNTSTAPSSAVASATPRHIRQASQSDSELPGIRRQWRVLLAATAKFYPSDMHLDDMERLSVDVGVPANRNTLRSQMSIYARHGVVERTGTGRYRLTPLGATAVGITLPGASPEPTPLPAEAADDIPLMDDMLSTQEGAATDDQLEKEDA